MLFFKDNNFYDMVVFLVLLAGNGSTKRSSDQMGAIAVLAFVCALYEQQCTLIQGLEKFQKCKFILLKPNGCEVLFV